jgi:membrane fusion protein, protease secretion system
MIKEGGFMSGISTVSSDNVEDVNTKPQEGAAGMSPNESGFDAPVRKGVWALMISAGLFLVWACWAPLDQGSPAHGFVKVEGDRKTVQHARGGVVEAILVREGDKVVAGQPLIRLNEAQAQAQQGSIESQLTSLLAIEARLQAEQVGAPMIRFPSSLLDQKAEPRSAEAMLVQQQLFMSRQRALAGEASILNETMTGLIRQHEGAVAREKANQRQLTLYSEELNAIRPMYEQGFVPRQRMFDLERAVASVDGQLSEDKATIGRIQSALSENRLKLVQLKDAFRKEVETQLTEIQRQIAELTERRVATRDELDRVVLRAPVAGVIVELSVHTVGGVVAPGAKLMDIVPEQGRLVVEVMIPPQLIDSVKLGQTADIHFSALDQLKVAAIEGRLVYVGADRQTDPRTDVSYFLGRIELTPQGLSQLSGHELRPGMPAEVVIKGGERTLANYLLKPLTARMRSGMTER